MLIILTLRLHVKDIQEISLHKRSLKDNPCVLCFLFLKNYTFIRFNIQ